MAEEYTPCQRCGGEVENPTFPLCDACNLAEPVVEEAMAAEESEKSEEAMAVEESEESEESDEAMAAEEYVRPPCMRCGGEVHDPFDTRCDRCLLLEQALAVLPMLGFDMEPLTALEEQLLLEAYMAAGADDEADTDGESTTDPGYDLESAEESDEWDDA
jgi:hypothetical protein